MNNSRLNTRAIATAAVVGAAYAALTMLLAPISYGALQLRVSEALCILPYFMPCTAWGLFLGCAIAGFLGWAGIAFSTQLWMPFVISALVLGFAGAATSRTVAT